MAGPSKPKGRRAWHPGAEGCACPMGAPLALCALATGRPGGVPVSPPEGPRCVARKHGALLQPRGGRNSARGSTPVGYL